MELPKVNIAVAASAVVAITSTLGGGVWYMSQQASVIEALQSDLEKLTVENSAVDRTNLIRDVENNSENIEELWDEVDNMVNYFTQLVQLQSRIAILEKTVEFTRRDGM